MPVVAGTSLLEKMGEEAAERLLLALAQPELSGELLERESFASRAAERGEQALGIDVHEVYF
jgi:hypothetical protein